MAKVELGAEQQRSDRTARVSSVLSLLLPCALLLSSAAAGAQQDDGTPWPTAGWAVSSAAQEGLEGDALERLVGDVRAGRYGFVDRVLVVRNGYLVIDERFVNDYAAIAAGRNPPAHPHSYEHPDWHPFYMGSELHTLQSVTKSVTSALIGIAIGRAEIDGTEVAVLPYFSDYGAPDPDGRKSRITLRDVLTMRVGMEWHETDRPIGPTNTTILLESSPDWFRFTLEQPMEAEPGAKWVYNSGASHLLSGIIRAASGEHVPEYAQRHLFAPLGIDAYHWKRTPLGFGDTEGGLYLRAEDLAKFGYLFLRDGVWDGRRVLPAGWVAESTARIVDDVAPTGRDDRGYGYKWWRLDRGATPVWAGLGYGGQYLLIVPEHELVGVITSWNISGGQPSVLGPFLDALLSSARGARR